MADTASMPCAADGARRRGGAIERAENPNYGQLLRLLADIVSAPLRRPEDKDDLQEPRVSV